MTVVYGHLVSMVVTDVDHSISDSCICSLDVDLGISVGLCLVLAL